MTSSHCYSVPQFLLLYIWSQWFPQLFFLINETSSGPVTTRTVEAGEMTPLAKCLQCQCQDLSSTSRTYIIKPGIMVEMGDSLGLAGQQWGQISELQVQRETVSSQRRWKVKVERDKYYQPLVSTHRHTPTPAPTRTYARTLLKEWEDSGDGSLHSLWLEDSPDYSRSPFFHF